MWEEEQLEEQVAHMLEEQEQREEQTARRLGMWEQGAHMLEEQERGMSRLATPGHMSLEGQGRTQAELGMLGKLVPGTLEEREQGMLGKLEQGMLEELEQGMLGKLVPGRLTGRSGRESWEGRKILPWG